MTTETGPKPKENGAQKPGGLLDSLGDALFSNLSDVLGRTPTEDDVNEYLQIMDMTIRSESTRLGI